MNKPGCALITSWFFFALTVTVISQASFGADRLRVGFVDPALPKTLPPHNAAALEFARSAAEVMRLGVAPEGCWRDADHRLRASEEFDVVWFHQGDDPAAAHLGQAGGADLLAWLEGGGALLLSGATGRVLNELAIEPTPLRVLGVNEVPFVSGIRVLDRHRGHPAFAGLDTTKPVLLTTHGHNALTDFHGTAGPHGELLAHGSGVSERPLVEYRVGAGRVIFVGWRLADFTTAGDEHRPNLERLFTNLLQYLSAQNQNRARLVAPPGQSRYERRSGVPFLLAPKPVELSAEAGTEKTAVSVVAEVGVQETAVIGERVTVKALGLTLTQRERPVAAFVAQRRAEQDAADRQDAELLRAVRVEKPAVRFVPAPLKPLEIPRTDQSLLLGRSLYMAPGDGWGDVTPAYEPVEDGGFQITGGKRSYNRMIVHGQNRIQTGDLPVFQMSTAAGVGVYDNWVKDDEKVFPLWPRPDGQHGGVWPCMGTLQLGVSAPDGKVLWLDQMPGLTITTTFTIRTPKPVVKRVRTNLSGQAVVTPAEMESVVTVEPGPAPSAVKPDVQPTILLQPAAKEGGPQPPGTVAAPAPVPAPLVPAERQLLMDLSAAFNTTQEELAATQFISDCGGSVAVGTWWHILSARGN